MNKRTAIIGALVSLVAWGQPLLVGMGVILTSAGVMLLVPEKLEAESVSYYYNRGIQQYNAGDHEGAITAFTQTIKLNPKHKDAYIYRGISKKKLEDHYGAIEDYTQAIEIDPRYAIAYVNRGIAKENLGDLNGACSDWRNAASLGYQDASQWVRNQC
tara:strand:+ start:246 stop:719 length:474 start_codon:yes stop_codon:yes gene_type:complete